MLNKLKIIGRMKIISKDTTTKYLYNIKNAGGTIIACLMIILLEIIPGINLSWNIVIIIGGIYILLIIHKIIKFKSLSIAFKTSFDINDITFRLFICLIFSIIFSISSDIKLNIQNNKTSANINSVTGEMIDCLYYSKNRPALNNIDEPYASLFKGFYEFTNKNYIESKRYFHKSLNSPVGEYYYGMMIYNGYDDIPQRDIGIEYIKHAAEQNNYYAEYFLFKHYLYIGDIDSSVKYAKQIILEYCLKDMCITPIETKLVDTNIDDCEVQIIKDYQSITLITFTTICPILLGNMQYYYEALDIFTSLLQNQNIKSLHPLIYFYRAGLYLKNNEKVKSKKDFSRSIEPNAYNYYYAAHYLNSTKAVGMSKSRYKRIKTILINESINGNTKAIEDLENLYKMTGETHNALILEHILSFNSLYNKYYEK